MVLQSVAGHDFSALQTGSTWASASAFFLFWRQTSSANGRRLSCLSKRNENVTPGRKKKLHQTRLRKDWSLFSNRTTKRSSCVSRLVFVSLASQNRCKHHLLRSQQARARHIYSTNNYEKQKKSISQDKKDGRSIDLFRTSERSHIKGANIGFCRSREGELS